MIKSMTGFASATREDELGTVGVTIRAVNHRYLDLQLRVPSSLADREAALRAIVQKHVARGRLELSVTAQLRRTPAPEIELNLPLVEALRAAVDQARAGGLLDGGLRAGDLLRVPQALTIRDAAPDAGNAAALAGLVERTVDDVLTALDGMRTHEGTHLRADLDARHALLGQLIDQIATAADEGRRGLESRLQERVAELTRELSVDRAALAQEIVRTAARSDISEEVTRFRGHLVHWDALSEAGEPCGRKLDFLLQEMNREINTIGSKADGLGVSELIVSAKAELERMREQVQNVE